MLLGDAKSAFIWSALDTFMRQGIGFVITIVLARLLAPEDFGTLALLALFLGIAGVFVSGGFSAALIQKQDISLVDESAVFWFNLASGVVAAALLCFVAPWVADFYSTPVLKPLVMLMALNILISSAGAIHSTLFMKRLDFRTPMKIGAICTCVSGIVGISLAYAGYGVWALGWQAVVSTVVSTLLLWLLSPWRPLLRFSSASLRRLVGFGGWMFASNLLDMVYQRGYTLLLGKFYTTHDLGIYKQADNTQQLPVSIITAVVSRVTFPIYASLNEDKVRLRNAVRLSVRSITLITSPIMMGLCVLAAPFVNAVFGEQWLPAAPILQILCIVGLLWPLHAINLNVLQAQGYSKLNFRLAIIKKITGVLLLCVGIFYGVLGVAFSRVVQSVIALMINGYFTKKFLNYSVGEQVMDCLPSLLLSILMAGIVYVALNWIGVGRIGGLITMVLLGALFYIFSHLLFRTRASSEVVGYVRSQRCIFF